MTVLEAVLRAAAGLVLAAGVIALMAAVIRDMGRSR